jgi:predicted dehydrogenase
MNPTYTAAVIGGGLGGRLSLDALQASDRYTLVAAADLRPEVRASLEADYPGLRTFATPQELFAAAPVDVVCVSTYPPSHEEVTLAALALPGLKGVLVEKPLADTAAAGRRILEAIEKRGIPTVTPHNLRTLATPLEIVRRVQAGEIGELRTIEVQCDKWDLLNAGIHWLDFCLAATSEAPVKYVMTAGDISTRTYRDGMQVETEAVTFVENANGTRFIVQTGDFVNVNVPGQGTLFRLVGSQGLIEFFGWSPGYRILNAEFPKGEFTTPAEQGATRHQRHLENLAAQIDSGKPDYRLPRASQTALEICEAAFLSMEHGCKVTFPYADFTPPAKTDWQPGKPYSGQGGGRDGRKLE